MSLNYYERILLDYLQANPDELAYWDRQVKELERTGGQRGMLARELDERLWAYFDERSEHEPRFREIAEREGRGRVSLLNLAEYFFRAWLPPRPKRKKGAPGSPPEDSGEAGMWSRGVTE